MYQDNAYFCRTPADALTVWIAIDPATEDNGAVRYIPGSHKQGMLPHEASDVIGNSIGLAIPPAPASTNETSGSLDPGDALIHHCQVIHRSEPNNSSHARCAFLMPFFGAHTPEDPKLIAGYRNARTVLEQK